MTGPRDSVLSNPPSQREPLEVLVVDDDPPTRQLTSLWLEKAGMPVAKAGSGEEALEYVAANHAKLGVIVLDVMMPGMDGYEVLENLQKNPDAVGIPVVLLTAHANEDLDVVKGIERGAVDHLQKPFKGPILQARIRALREKRVTEMTMAAKLQKAQEAATTDPLTGLGNRREFDKQLEREIAYTKRHREPFSLLMIDLDRFKSVNDTYGHGEGDRVLLFLAEKVNETLRKSDLAFRLGGEEFAILLRGSDAKSAMAAARRVSEALTRKAFEFEGGDTRVITFSGGIARADVVNSFDTEGMLDRADQALYRAKHGGRNRTELEEHATAEAPRWSLTAPSMDSSS